MLRVVDSWGLRKTNTISTHALEIATMQIKSECLKALRTIFGTRPTRLPKLAFDRSGQQASDYIRSLIESGQPCMISRLGSNELDVTVRVLERQQNAGLAKRLSRYLWHDGAVFWWDQSIRRRMTVNAGFFPADDDSLTRFGQRMLDDIAQIDVLGSWRLEEFYLRQQLDHATTVSLLDLDPFRHAPPWSIALAGKRVLVIHPFEQTIRSQYEKRELLFRDADVLPGFELLTLKAVQSNGMNQVNFGSWFEALQSMSNQIGEIEFDIAIIGAGAYGLPLAAFVKRLGKQAIHLGGTTQLLFGIKGRRWDDFLQDFYNEHWTRPTTSETPPRSDLIEGHAYW